MLHNVMFGDGRAWFYFVFGLENQLSGLARRAILD